VAAIISLHLLTRAGDAVPVGLAPLDATSLVRTSSQVVGAVAATVWF
jgi:hypothetical protein